MCVCGDCPTSQLVASTHLYLSPHFFCLYGILENGTIPHSLDHHSVFTGDVCLLSDQGCVLSDQGCVLSDQGCVLSDQGCVLSDQGCVLSDQGCLLSDQGCVLSDQVQACLSELE